MKSPVQKTIDLDLSDGEIEKVNYETKSKFSLIKQLNLSATKSKFNHIECQYETALAEASLQLKSVDSKIALERRRINQAIQNIKTDKKKSTNHLSWSPMEIITDGKKFLQARRSQNKIEMESTFLSPRGPKENRKDHKRKLFYEFDKMYTVENWKTTIGSNDDNQGDFLRGQPVQDFEKEMHKIVSRINHPSVKDPREILKSLLVPSPIPDHLLQQYKQTKKNKGDMLSKNANGIRLQSNHIEVDMNIVDGEGGFRRIKHKFNPEKLQKKIIEKYSDYLTDKRYDTQTIVKKITREYSKALGKINRNGLMVKVPKNFKVWMQDYNDFYHERDEDDQDDYPDYLVQKQLDDYLDNKLNNEVDKTMNSESQSDLRQANSPKKRVFKKSTFPDQDGTLNVSQDDEEDEEYDDEDAEDDFDERMEKKRKQQLKLQQKRKHMAGRASQNEVEEGEQDEENNEEQEEEDENEQFQDEEGEDAGGRLETKKSKFSQGGEEVVSQGEVEQEEDESEDGGESSSRGKKTQNSQRFMKKKTTEEDRPPRKEYTYKERKTYSNVKKYEAIKVNPKEPKQDPSQTPEAQRARQQEIEAEQKRLQDYYNERINSINNKYKEKTDVVKSPTNNPQTIKKQNSKDSQTMGPSVVQRQRSNQDNPQRNNSPSNLRASQVSTKTEGVQNLKQSHVSFTGHTNSVASDDLEDNDRESIHELEQRPPPSATTKSSGSKKPSSSSKKKPFNIDINSSKSKNKKSTTSSKKESLQLAKRSSAADAFVEDHHENQQDYSPMQKSTVSVQPSSTQSPKRDRARTHNQSSSSATLKTDESPSAATGVQKQTTQLSHFSPRKNLENNHSNNATPQQHNNSKSKGPQKNGAMNLKKDGHAGHRYSLSPGLKPHITDRTSDEEEDHHHRSKGNNIKVPAAVKRVRSAKIKHPLPPNREEEKDERRSSKYARQSSVPEHHNQQERVNDDYHNVYMNQSTGPEPTQHQRHHSSSSKLTIVTSGDKHRASVQPNNTAHTPKSKYKQEARFSVGLVKTQSPTRKTENGLQASGMGYDFGYGKHLTPNNSHLRDRKQSHMSATLNASKNSSPNASKDHYNSRTSLYKKETNSTASKFGHDQNMLYNDAMNIIDTEFAGVSEVPVVGSGSKQSLMGTEVNSPEIKKSEFDLEKYMQDIKNQNAKRSHTIIDMLLAAPSVMDNDIEVIERPDYQIKVPQNLRFEDEEYKMLFGEIYTWHKTIKKDVHDSDPDYLSEIEDSEEEGEEKKDDEEESTQRMEPESMSTKRNATIESSDEETRRDEIKLKKK